MPYSPRWQHLKDIERKRISPTPDHEFRLHRLERPVPWSDDIWPSSMHIEQYPHYPPLIERLAGMLGVNQEQVVLGAGIEDFIRTLILLCCEPGQGFVYTWPTCAMFDVYAQVFQTKAIKIVTRPDTPPAVSDIASFAKEAQLVLLPNPGQPVETCYSLSELRQIATACWNHDAVFAIDEAYFGFGAPSALPLIKDFSNVLILRTFSKAFGAAGIRVGYAVGDERVIKPLEAFRLSGEIAGPSLQIAMKLLDSFDKVKAGIEEIVDGRDWLRDWLIEYGLDAKGKYANHVLLDLKSPEKASQMYECLREAGFHVKGGYPEPLANHLLITAGPRSLMQKFLSFFAECNSA